MLQKITPFVALAAIANAAVIKIDVGEAGITFNPDSVTAAVGDSLEFHFYSAVGPHSVAVGSLEAPCSPKSDTWFSGLVDGDDAGTVTWTVDVTSTDPIYFYCSARMHCPNGMVGAVNAPSGAGVDALKAAAKGKSVSAPPAPAGGVLATGGSGEGSASSTMSEETGSMTTAGPATTASESASSAASESGSETAAPTSESAPTTAAESSAETPAPTSGSGSGSSTASPSPAVQTTNAAGHNSQTPVVLGLAGALAGLVAMMA